MKTRETADPMIDRHRLDFLIAANDRAAEENLKTPPQSCSREEAVTRKELGRLLVEGVFEKLDRLGICVKLQRGSGMGIVLDPKSFRYWHGDAH